MPRLLNAIKQDIAFFFKSLRLKFVPRLVFPESRLQEEGTRGGDIVQFQQRFNLYAERFNISAPVSGVYDAATRKAVAAYQRDAMSVLDADGFIGPETSRALHIKLLEGR